MLVMAAVLFATGGAAIKAVELSGWQVASFRSGIAALVLLLMLPEARRGWGWRATLVGVAYAVTMVLFVLANRQTTSANAVFIQSTSPVYLVFLGPLLLAERTSRRDVVFLIPLLGGLALFLVGAQDPLKTAPNPELGNIFAALSGFCWALTTVGLRWLGTRPAGQGSPLAAMVAGNLIAFVAVLPMAWPVATAVPTSSWLILGYLGVFQIALPYSFVARAIGQVRALDASLIFLIEPAFNPVFAWLVHREVPGTWPMVGALVILGTSLVRAVVESRRRRALDPPSGRF
jgi:drug/metabolite transporter (DMT)-like permease